MQKQMPRFLLAVVLLATVFVYYPGLSGPFVFDDYINVVNNQNLRVDDFSKEAISAAAFSIPNGVFGRPLSMLSFAGNFYFGKESIGPFESAFNFKVVNLFIHLLNGSVAFLLISMAVEYYRIHWRPELPHKYPEWLAVAVSAAWLLHPLNLTGVLYVVQRMTSLAAFFTFVGLLFYVWGRIRLADGRRWGWSAICFGVIFFTPLAVLSKENGALLPLFILAAEIIFFRFQTKVARCRRLLFYFFSVFVVLPVLFVAGYLAINSDFLLAAYSKRDFTLPERLLTEARVFWFYLRLIVMPSTSLMGLFHDDIPVSHNLFDQVTTIPAILGLVGLSLCAWMLRRHQPIVSFGIIFFIIGHSLESTVYPLELIHEHRNYLPMLGILLAFCHLLLEPLHAVSTKLIRRTLVCMLIPLFAFDTYSRASSWATPATLWWAEVEHHPSSVRANVAMGDYYANALSFDKNVRDSNYLLAKGAYDKALVIGKYNTDALFGLLRLSELYEMPIDQALITDLAHGLETLPISSNTNDRLVAMALCRLKETCPLTLSQAEKILHSPLKNPKVVGRDKVLIYSALVFYYFRVKKDNSAAMDSARSGIELDPGNIDLHLWLATIYIATNETEKARGQIALLKRLDTKNTRAKDIDFLAEQL